VGLSRSRDRQEAVVTAHAHSLRAARDEITMTRTYVPGRPGVYQVCATHVHRAGARGMRTSAFELMIHHIPNEKRSEATQTLRAGCSKAEPQTNIHTDRGDYSTLRSLA